MEAVAAAASVAGIITLVFQSIDGLAKFRELFADVSSASKTISGLLSDINSLIQVLEEVRDVLEQVEAQKTNQNFASLDVKLADCSKDIHVWLSTAKILRPPSEQGGKAWLQKFRLAVNKKAVQTIRHEIGRHRQIITLSLSVLGRNIDLSTSEQVYRVQSSLSQTLSNHNVHEATLSRIENISRASLQRSAHSLSSMHSIRSELSRLESMIIESKQTPNGEPLAREASSQRIGSLNSKGRKSDSATPTESLASSARAGGHNPPKSWERLPNGHARNDEIENIEYSSSFLYASFAGSQTISKRPKSNMEPSKVDCHMLMEELQGAISEVYPPCLAEYISLHQTLTVCQSSIRLLHEAPATLAKGDQYLDNQGASFAILKQLQQKQQLLTSALRLARDVCIVEGYSLVDIDGACRFE